jgi:pyruvate/2-oxoglutarate dehydrogenase complex dihydrolipoamide dehydrogenase (E3) component
VVVAGGGEIGAETALMLATQGRTVTVVDQLPGIALNEGMARRYTLMKELGNFGVRQLTGTSITAITDDGVQVNTAQGSETLPADTVVIALGMKPNSAQSDAFKGIAAEYHVIGDAKEVSDALRASREGYALGLSI